MEILLSLVVNVDVELVHLCVTYVVIAVAVLQRIPQDLAVAPTRLQGLQLPLPLHLPLRPNRLWRATPSKILLPAPCLKR